MNFSSLQEEQSVYQVPSNLPAPSPTDHGGVGRVSSTKRENTA